MGELLLRTQKARGAKQPIRKYFMINKHESEYGKVCWVSKKVDYRKKTFATLVAYFFRE